MKIQNPPSVTLPPVHPALTGSPLLSEEVFFMEEIWKPVKDYPDYQVSNFGRIKSYKVNYPKFLKTTLERGKYKYVSLCNNGIVKKYKVHQLVAVAFLGHIQNGYESVINHIDLDTLNNCVWNLEIVKQRENANKKHIKHSSIYTGVTWNKKLKKWRTCLEINKKAVHLGYYEQEFDAHIAYEYKIIELDGFQNLHKRVNY